MSATNYHETISNLAENQQRPQRGRASASLGRAVYWAAYVALAFVCLGLLAFDWLSLSRWQGTQVFLLLLIVGVILDWTTRVYRRRAARRGAPLN